MAAAKKIITGCAVTGSVHTPSMSPYLPVTAQEIADAAPPGSQMVGLGGRNAG